MEAVRVLLEKYEIVRAIFRPDTKGGFDYRPVLSATTTPHARLAIMASAIDWVLTLQQADAAKETSDEGKKRAHRRYADAVVALSKAVGSMSKILRWFVTQFVDRMNCIFLSP
jgi:type I restriction enzyme R subunit